jgi:catechol 2,3-dioxygenase-like lactoylglutathione lyase family enzyme
MNWTLEVVVIPVSDVDRARAFYAEKLGFEIDHDAKISEEYHVVQLTPRGRAARSFSEGAWRI